MKFECYVEDIRASLRNYGVCSCLVDNMTDWEVLEAGNCQTEKELNKYLEKVKAIHKVCGEVC